MFTFVNNTVEANLRMGVVYGQTSTFVAAFLDDYNAHHPGCFISENRTRVRFWSSYTIDDDGVIALTNNTQCIQSVFNRTSTQRLEYRDGYVTLSLELILAGLSFGIPQGYGYFSFSDVSAASNFELMLSNNATTRSSGGDFMLTSTYTEPRCANFPP